MTGTQVFIVAIAALAVLGALAVFAVAARSRPGKPAVGSVDRTTRRRDAAAAKERALVGAVVGATVVDTEPATEPVADIEEPVPPDPLITRPVVEPDEYDVTRRQFFNRGILAVFGIFLAQFGLASLAFMWPKLKAGGFGSKVSAGNVTDLLAAVTTPDGRVAPLFVSAAKSYVMPFRGSAAGSSFEGLPVIAGDLIALWQRCVHLGCRVPQCDSSQGFECPCHGSKYNYHGEYEDGPAPRNLDRFVVSVDDAGNFIIDTGQVIQTARSSTKTAEYPQGPSCV